MDEAMANLREVLVLALESEDLSEHGLAQDPTILVTLELEPLRREVYSKPWGGAPPRSRELYSGICRLEAGGPGRLAGPTWFDEGS